MASGAYFESFGLPIPHPSEIEVLRRGFNRPAGRISLVEHYARETRNRWDLPRLVLAQEAKVLLEQNEHEADQIRVNAELLGLNKGFYHMVGCMTYLKYRRSGVRSLDDYFGRFVPQPLGGPTGQDAILGRLVKIMRGTDELDTADRMGAISSADQSSAFATSYLEAAQGLVELSTLMIDEVPEDEHRHHFTSGVARGLQRSVVMYSEVHQHMAVGDLNSRLGE